jgi:hypothetical protein
VRCVWNDLEDEIEVIERARIKGLGFLPKRYVIEKWPYRWDNYPRESETHGVEGVVYGERTED